MVGRVVCLVSFCGIVRVFGSVVIRHLRPFASDVPSFAFSRIHGLLYPGFLSFWVSVAGIRQVHAGDLYDAARCVFAKSDLASVPPFRPTKKHRFQIAKNTPHPNS